jgi:CheY-like chemotaxis protein
LSYCSNTVAFLLPFLMHTPTYKYQRVMIIDDSELDRFIIEKFIKHTNFANEIIMCSTGNAALAYLTSIADLSQLPSIIFLDINMPVMTGFDFLEEYDKLPENTKRQNIIMLSSSINQDEIKKATSNPYVLKFMGKPIIKDALENLL